MSLNGVPEPKLGGQATHTTPIGLISDSNNQPQRPLPQLHRDLLPPRRRQPVIFHAIAEDHQLIGGHGNPKDFACFQDAFRQGGAGDG